MNPWESILTPFPAPHTPSPEEEQMVQDLVNDPWQFFIGLCGFCFFMASIIFIFAAFGAEI